jgi:hypothetical protein
LRKALVKKEDEMRRLLGKEDTLQREEVRSLQ